MVGETVYGLKLTLCYNSVNGTLVKPQCDASRKWLLLLVGLPKAKINEISTYWMVLTFYSVFMSSLSYSGLKTRGDSAF